MNRLSTAKRAHLIDLLVEGMSLRSVERVTGVSIKTITKLLVAAGEACAVYHDDHVRNLRKTHRVQADETWSFIYAKEKSVKHAKAVAPEAGDTWTWLTMDADHKLVISWPSGRGISARPTD